MSRAASRRIEVSPAALGSIALHVAVAAAFVISWGNRDLKVGSVVPVTIVSGPPAEPRPVVQGPETLEPATETPVAEAPPEPAPPPPAPAPTPTPKAAKPAEKAPAPLQKATPRPAQNSLDLDALSASLTAPARNTPPRPSSAAQGPNRPATAPVARETAGASEASSTAALEGLADELQRRWKPNCSLDGRRIIVKATFTIGFGGQVVGDVKSEYQNRVIERGLNVSCANNDTECLVQAAADRAVSAIYAAAPYRGLPRNLYGQRITVNFNAREACG